MEKVDLAEHARRVVDKAPPLTDDQKANLMRLFGTGRKGRPCKSPRTTTSPTP